MSAADSSEIRYGNLRRPRLPGFAGMGAIPSLILIAGAVVLMVLIFTVGLVPALLWAVFVLAAVLPEALPTADGVGRYSKWVGAWRFKRASKDHKAVLMQGLTGMVPDGECRLPGVAAQVSLSTHTDIHGREFGMVEWANSGLYAVVIQCSPPGHSGLDKDIVDGLVAQWGAWMGQLNTIGEVAGAAVVIESAPDSGHRQRRAIDRGRVDGAPAYSVRLAEEMKESSRQGAPTTITRITVTFNAKIAGGDEVDGRVRTRDEMATAIGDVLPTLTGTLSGTGAGMHCYPCRAQQIVDFVRVAYDPAVAPLVEEAQAEGGTGLNWDQAGPVTAKNHFDFYQHETAFSRTWQMREGPRGLFFSKVLDKLLSPHRDIARKRVALVYRPESPLKSADIAENDVTSARLVASQNPRAKAANRIAVQAAEKTAEQEALGSPLIRVGLLVTVTVFEHNLLSRASRVIVSTLAPQARLRMRLPRGGQDVAFVASLPLGMVPYYHGGLGSFADGM